MSKQIIEKDQMLQKAQKTITEIRDQMRGNVRPAFDALRAGAQRCMSLQGAQVEGRAERV